MARYTGEVVTETNYEPKTAGPMDARLSVESYADLLSPDTFDDKYTWNGMSVSVTEDGSVYELLDAENRTSEEAWSKVITQKKLDEIAEEIEDTILILDCNVTD